MKDFGTGPTLRETHAWLQDDQLRRELILDVVERNSVIEGLPPLTAETRRLILESMAAISSSPRTSSE